ncbi:hypothetical protein SCLCIDRAFT_1215828 [Scleroderma citrinum Foug A]|uniref:Uncharacterized protein n=1 Tax=Scleroderma citrinum Foug A TaxID=1036808 RepID=A0A0C3AA16_9AGAM|nr:hypothetical protein SCLCIDRAFT_1215828 [Scleroderma citrinum Foug A]
MLAILHHICKFLLSALERYSPVRLLQYLLALCRTMDFSRSKSKCSGQDSSHEFLPKPLILAEEKESLSEEGIVNPVGHVISACRTPGELEEGPAQMAEIFPSTRNGRCEDPLGEDECIKSNPPLKEGLLRRMWTNSSSLFHTAYLFDHPGSIRHSLAQTQIEVKCSPADTRGQNKHKVWSTDVKKWRKFSKIYANDIQQVGLLATILLVANMSFLSIHSIDTAPGGLSYLPQIQLLVSFGCIGQHCDGISCTLTKIVH